MASCEKFGRYIDRIAYGFTRKMCLLCIVLSFIGWIVYVGGFISHVSRIDLTTSTTARTLFIPYWTTLVAGPVTFICGILNIALGSNYPIGGRIMQAITLFTNFIYVASLSSPFLLSALFKFGESKFGAFENTISNAIPIPPMTMVLGIDNEFTTFLTGIVGNLYDLLENGVEAVVDLILRVPSDDSFQHAVAAQFSGCIISVVFIALSVIFWPFFSSLKTRSTSQEDTKK